MEKTEMDTEEGCRRRGGGWVCENSLQREREREKEASLRGRSDETPKIKASDTGRKTQHIIASSKRERTPFLEKKEKNKKGKQDTKIRGRG